MTINIKSIAIILLSVILFFSCKKKDYLTDNGVSTAKSSLSTYDYLAQNKYKMFDTLITIIDHYSLKEEVNNAPTFFAPSDYSIHKYLQLIGGGSLETLYGTITADSIRQYFFNQKITLQAAPELPMIIESKGNTNCAIQKIKQTDPQYYTWSSEPVYFLYYIKVVGELDPPDGTATDEDRKVVCQTSNIETVSGNMLHVLNNNHIFIRF